jgi:hypothetical protein
MTARCSITVSEKAPSEGLRCMLMAENPQRLYDRGASL